MKLKLFLPLLMINVFAISFIQAKELTKCYCSDVCEPRDMKADDTPFVDNETGLYFCKQRDKDNYGPNKCATKACKEVESD